MNPRSRSVAIALLLATTASLVACRPELVVRISTVVYRDGSLSRRVELRGRTSEGKVPVEDDWLAASGVDLSRPDAWRSIDRAPGLLKAEGFFQSVEDLPPILSFHTKQATRQDRVRTDVEIDDAVVVRRWIYREMHGDPYSAADSSAALDALIELAVEALREELKLHFGEQLDTQPAEALLRGEGRSLASGLLTVTRSTKGWERVEERTRMWMLVLSQHGAPVAPVDDPEEFWEEQGPALFEWARQRVAGSLSIDGAPVRPEELTFWPAGDDLEERANEIARRVWGSEEQLFDLIEPHLATLAGYYGGDDVPRYRFEVRARIPGTLVATNGTPDGDSVVWLFRERDLTFGEHVLRIESVEPRLEELTALGARRDFDRAALARLADILWKQDPKGVLIELVQSAVGEGRLEMLRDEDRIPAELDPLARELADLLDPAVPLDPPL